MDYRTEAPKILRDFLIYHETIKGHSHNTVDEYFLDLRTFFRYLKIHRDLVPRDTELEDITIDDVDLDKHCVRVTRKGGDEAIVYFSDEATEYLEKWLLQRSENKKIPKDEHALFISSQNKRLCVRSIEKLIKKYALRSVPLKHITPHKLRATYATNLYEATGDIYLVAETLGHKDVKTTKDHYANMSDKRKEENRNAVILNEQKK